MMTLEEMRERKEALNLQLVDISVGTGVPLSTVQKVFAGITVKPQRKTMDKLECFLKDPEDTLRGSWSASEWPGHGSQPVSYRSRPQADIVRESAAVYGQKWEAPERMVYNPCVVGPYRLKDYLALPEQVRVELIDGYFFTMEAPTMVHQKISAELHIQFEKCIEEHCPECEVLYAPLDLQLDHDDRTCLQPDLVIFCDMSVMNKRRSRMMKAPDLVVEILSPSTRYRDMHIKMRKYAAAGVREYWIVDPEKEKIVVYSFTPHPEGMQVPDPEHADEVMAYDAVRSDYLGAMIPFAVETDIAVYGFSSEIPIGISGGECSVDFERIRRKLERYREEE